MSARGPIVVLVAPQMGENIGMAARAMANMGLTDMRIVAPRDGWPNDKAIAAAAGADAIIAAAGLFDDIGAAVADCHAVYATSAREHRMAKPVVGPQLAMERARRMIASGRRVAILFGRERIGLLNDEVSLADTIVTIPVSPDFPSLNIAQAVLILSYEWLRSGGEEGELLPYVTDLGSPPASAGEVHALFRHVEGALETAGFFTPEHKRETMTRNLRNILHRRELTEQDVRTLHGVVRALERGPHRRHGTGEPPE